MCKKWPTGFSKYYCRFVTPKLTGNIQDTWNSVGCYGDVCYSISEVPGGSRETLMTYHRPCQLPSSSISQGSDQRPEPGPALGRVLTDAAAAWWLTHRAGHQRGLGTARALWYWVAIIRTASHTIPMMSIGFNILRIRNTLMSLYRL